MGSALIRAENIGVKFRLRLEKRPTLKKFVLQGIRQRSSKEFWALRNVSFTVHEGETLGIIGLNGSGKSTLLRVIGGIFAPDEGTIVVKGRVSTLLSLTAGFQPELSGRENVYLVGMLMGLSLKEIKEHFTDIVDFAELGSFINAPVKTYSAGMLARLGFAIAAHLECDILLIDEILGVGDQSFRRKSQAKIRELLKANRTVVLVSHSMEAILEFSTKVLWLHKGRVQDYGAPERVVEAYKNFSTANHR